MVATAEPTTPITDPILANAKAQAMEELASKPKRTRAPRKPKAATPPVEDKLTPTTGTPEPEPAPTPAPAKPARRAKSPAKSTALVPVKGDIDMFAFAIEDGADLSPAAQKKQYERLQNIVTQGLALYYPVGLALGEIKERQYFKLDDYDTFEDFVRERWDLGSIQRANQYITAARTTQALKNFFRSQEINLNPLAPLPTVESHARALAKLGTIEEQADAWLEAVKTAPDRRGRPHLVASHIEAVVQRLLGFKALPEQTGSGTDTPTPGTRPPAETPEPEVENKPEDNEPVDSGAPPIGQEPDVLDHFDPEEHVADTQVKSKGKVKVLTPRIALEYLIEALNMGAVSHADPYISALVEVANGGLGEWLDSETDAVHVDAGHIQAPPEDEEQGGEEDDNG